MEGRNKMTLHSGMTAMGTDIFIDLRNKSYTITAELEVDSKANGTIVCQGGRFGGLSFFLRDGKPAFAYNYLGLNTTTITAPNVLAPGKHKVTYDFTYEGRGAGKGGIGTISVDGQQVAKAKWTVRNPVSSRLMISQTSVSIWARLLLITEHPVVSPAKLTQS